MTDSAKHSAEKSSPPMPAAMSREQVRDIDRRAIEEYGLPGIVLMENAGRGAAELLMSLGVSGRAIVCAGRGNNGGDGFVIARHLENHGIDARVLVFGGRDEFHGDAATNLQVVERARTPLRCFGDPVDAQDLQAELNEADWIVDALLGTGSRGEIREPYVTVIREINNAAARVLAVDLPSGLDCDSGQPLGVAVRADHTATFVARKLGFDAPGAQDYTGTVHVIDIGVPRRMLLDV